VIETEDFKTQVKRMKGGPSAAEERIEADLSEAREAMAVTRLSPVKLRRALRADWGGSRDGKS
jgi:hypothetical protein